MKVKFTIHGEPEGKGRPRFRSCGKYAQPYTPDGTLSYENLIKVEYQNQCRGLKFDQGTPIDMRIMAYYTIPKSVSRKKRELMLQHVIRPTKKPDFDNLGKVVCDPVQFPSARFCGRCGQLPLCLPGQ